MRVIVNGTPVASFRTRRAAEKYADFIYNQSVVNYETHQSSIGGNANQSIAATVWVATEAEWKKHCETYGG